MNSIEDIRTFLNENLSFAWLAIVGVSTVLAITVKVIVRVVAARLRRLAEQTESKWDDAGVAILDGLKAWVLFVWFFYGLSKPLEQSDSLRRLLLVVAVVTTFLQIAKWGLLAIKTWRNIVLEPKIRQDPSSAAALGLSYSVLQAVFIVVLVLIGLSNLGVDITALIAGLGVGGIAVALAAQNVLGDLLASLSIVLDKPFVIGDFIVAGNEKGEVEHIGIKTTRLRSLSGEQLILSNKDLLESRIQNFKRMWRRRVVLSFGVTYSTPLEKLKQIPDWVKAYVTSKKELEFDRCHFNNYGASSLDFELVFFVTDADYNKFMDLKQQILLEVFKRFADEGVEFAYPSQSLYIEKLARP